MRKFILFLLVVFLLVSCSSKPAVKKNENPVDLYVSGVDLMKKKKYDDAVKKFNAIREQYPFDPMALVAAVKLGDTYFLKKDYVLATSTYEDYFKAHPDEENIPYVLFKLGECYEKLSPSADRDQANTIKGIERITYLRNRYPATQYAAESEGRLKMFIQKLADRELYVGEFYVRTAQYNAAIMRLESMLKQFPDSKNTDKALFLLYDAHRQLGNQEKADEYLQALRTKYPKSVYARATIRERKTLKITQVDPAQPGQATASVKKQAPPATAQKPAQTPPAAPEPVPSVPTQAGFKPPAEIQQTSEIPLLVDPMATSSAGGPSDQVTTTPQAPTYAERPKKVIDLRPPEQPAAPAQPAPAPETPKASAPVASAPKAQAPEAPKAPQTQASLKPAEAPKPAEPAKPQTEKPETGKTSDKKLGFLDQKKPIDIVSDTMEGFDKEKYVLFKGNVVAKQDDLYIYSDTMEAYMSADTNEIDRANAKGHVRIIKQNRTATSREAYFDNVKGEILLKGDAVVTSDKDRVEGDVVTYYVNEDLAVVTVDKVKDKDKKAKVTIYPKQKQ